MSRFEDLYTVRFGSLLFGSVNDTEASVFGYSVFTRFVRPLSIKFKFHWRWDVVCIETNNVMLCCCSLALLLLYGKTKKAACVCVCGNWFGTKNGAQTLVGGFLQEIRAESRLICYCTSWQRTPIFVGATGWSSKQKPKMAASEKFSPNYDLFTQKPFNEQRDFTWNRVESRNFFWLSVRL